MNKMFQKIILIVLTTLNILVQTSFVHDTLVTEETDGMPNDFSSLATLVGAMDKNESTEMSDEEVDTTARSARELHDLKVKVKTTEAPLHKSHDLKRGHKKVKTVAFHAVSINHYIPDVKRHFNISFKNVKLNIGDGFKNSYFRAPVAGLYMFSATLLSVKEDHYNLFSADLVVNGQTYVRIYGKGSPHRHDQSSSTIVANLGVGETVALKLVCCDRTRLFGGYSSSFSGALLSASPKWEGEK